MAHDVGGEIGLDSSHLRQFLQFFVIHTQGYLILSIGLFRVERTDDWKQIVAVVIRVFLNDVGHARLQRDADGLLRLVAHIDDGTVAKIVFSQVGHIDKGHSERIDAEKENVACQVDARAFLQFQ